MAADIRWERLRADLHAMVDDVLARYAEALPREALSVSVEDIEPLRNWTHTFPDGTHETYDSATWFRVEGSSGSARMLLAHTRRDAWGEFRERMIVFKQLGRPSSNTFYPLTEFVKTEDGSYAALIPDPKRPRASFKDGDELPPRFLKARVDRTDQLFHSVVGAPSLRLVLPEQDAEGMIMHAYWVAELRGRLRG